MAGEKHTSKYNSKRARERYRRKKAERKREEFKYCYIPHPRQREAGEAL